MYLCDRKGAEFFEDLQIKLSSMSYIIVQACNQNCPNYKWSNKY